MICSARSVFAPSFIPSLRWSFSDLQSQGLSLHNKMSDVVKVMSMNNSGLDVKDRIWLKLKIPDAFTGKEIWVASNKPDTFRGYLWVVRPCAWSLNFSLPSFVVIWYFWEMQLSCDCVVNLSVFVSSRVKSDERLLQEPILWTGCTVTSTGFLTEEKLENMLLGCWRWAYILIQNFNLPCSNLLD